jgi:3-oxoacyl-[acyl-carrier-protein] synthase II
MDAAEQCLSTVRSEGFKGVTPSWYATGLPNATAAIVASVHGFKGPNLTLLGHAAGLDALVMACRQIVAGRADAMLAGGFDWPSAWQLERLQRSTEIEGASAVHAGAGLVWLSRSTARAEPPCGQIIGWSQSSRSADNRTLVAAAARGQPAAEPIVHETTCGAAGEADHLAAGAPLQLVREVLMHGRSGCHAVVARGFGPAATCLLIQRPD